MENKKLTFRDVLVAVQLAEIAHTGQVDKNGLPYIRHPLSVMRRVYDAGYTSPIMLITAVLHDTIEDTHVMIFDILTAFGFDVATAVDSVTKTPKQAEVQETYREFVLRAMMHPVGRVIKFHDISDNMDPARAVKDKAMHLTDRYKWAMAEYAKRPSGIEGKTLFDLMERAGL